MLEGARPKSLSARVGTFNWPARYDAGGKQADAELAAHLFSEASVWGFQEAAWHPTMPAGTRMHTGRDSTGKAVGQVLAWRADVWSCVQRGMTLISPATTIQPEAAGPTVHREKHVVWADLFHNDTGHVIRFGVAHLVPSKHLGGAALDLWKRQRDGIIQWIDGCESPYDFVVLGDFNAEPGDRVAQPLVSEAGGVLHGPSHGDRHIDWIIYGKRLTGEGARVLPDTKQSDHRPVVGTIEA